MSNIMDNINFDNLSKEDLQAEIIKRDREITNLKKSYQDTSLLNDSQITEIMHRFGDLKKSYDEQSSSLLNILWIHCAKHNPDLCNIPSIDYESVVTESSTHIGQFIFGEFLGEGTFALVKSCREFDYLKEKDENYTKTFNFAAKIIDKNKIKNFTSLKRLSDEIGILRKLSSPYIIGFRDVIHTPKHLYIITERGGNDMFEFLHHNSGAVNEELARLIVVELLQAVNYIHQQGLCHRDLKPENVLLTFPNGNPFAENEPSNITSRLTSTALPLTVSAPTSPTPNYDKSLGSPKESPKSKGPIVVVKICDFGVSSKCHRKFMLQDFCGSPGFFAPEMLIQGCYFGDKADIWSIGCIILELALGHRRFCLYWMRAYSFDVIQDNDLFTRRITDTINSVLSSDMLRIDNEYEDFLIQFLQLQPSNRPGFKKISQHPWLKNMFVPPPSPSASRVPSKSSNANNNAAVSTLLASSSYNSHPADSLAHSAREGRRETRDVLEMRDSDQEMTSVDNYSSEPTLTDSGDEVAIASIEQHAPSMNNQALVSEDELRDRLSGLNRIDLDSSAHGHFSSSDVEIEDNTSNAPANGLGDLNGAGDEHSNLLLELYDNLNQLVNGFTSTHLDAYKKSFQPIASRPNHNFNTFVDTTSDASDGNDFETDSFRLPPTSNWKNLLSSAATSSLHVTLQQDYDTEIRPHPTVSPGASGQQSSQVYRSTEDSGMNSPSYSKLTKDFNTALGNALGNLTTVPPVQEKSKVRVLLVEDSAFQRKLMARRIQSVGIVSNGSWEVVQCEDGEKACAAVDEAVDTKEKFDVVVVDQTLSSDPNKMEGHEVVQYVRAKFRDAVIIGCTANVPKHSKSLLAGGADLVWSKPLPREDVIFANVDSMMKLRRPQLSSEQILRMRNRNPNNSGTDSRNGLSNRRAAL